MNQSQLRLHVLGSSCHLLIAAPEHADDILESARSELARLDIKFSTSSPDSVVASLNRNAGNGQFTPLDPEARSLFDYISTLWSQSNHLFDPTTHFLQASYSDSGKLMATDSQLKELLQLVGWSKIELGEEGASLTHSGMQIDLNSCIRPYALDCVRRIFLKAGVEHALIAMDKDSVTIGKQTDGANWLVGTKIPSKGNTAIARLKLNHKGFAIRGDFERPVLINEERFGRGLSPVDAYPVPGLLSVAVIADDCLTACSAASIARLKTERAALKWLDTLGFSWLAIDRELNCHGPLSL